MCSMRVGQKTYFATKSKGNLIPEPWKPLALTTSLNIDFENENFSVRIKRRKARKHTIRRFLWEMGVVLENSPSVSPVNP